MIPGDLIVSRGSTDVYAGVGSLTMGDLPRYVVAGDRLAIVLSASRFNTGWVTVLVDDGVCTTWSGDWSGT